MPDVHGIIHAQPNGQHDGHARDDVNGHLPEVQEADNVHQGQNDTTEHHETDLKLELPTIDNSKTAKCCFKSRLYILGIGL